MLRETVLRELVTPRTYVSDHRAPLPYPHSLWRVSLVSVGTKKRRKDEEVYSITSARRALSEDLHDRNIRYLVAMVIRTVCFILMIVVPSPWRWGFAVGAIVIPYLAVTIANAGRENEKDDGTAAIAPSEPQSVQLYDPTREFLR